METDGIRRRFELYADLLEDIHLQQVRLYARRQSASAPSSPSWDGMPGGVGVPGDRVGNAASAAVDLEREIAAKKASADAMRAELLGYTQVLPAREKNLLEARYFDGDGRLLTWQELADIAGVCEKTVQSDVKRAFEKLERMGL